MSLEHNTSFERTQKQTRQQDIHYSIQNAQLKRLQKKIAIDKQVLSHAASPL
jgi:hypothetical protein